MNDFRMGQHDSAIQRLEEDMKELRTDVRNILNIVNQRRGERHAVSVAFGAIGGSGIAIFFKLMAVKLGLHA